MDPVIAVYPGTFDPITNGHLDIIHRAMRIGVSCLIVAIGVNPRKSPLFDAQDRREFVKEATRNMVDVRVTTFDGLLVDLCRTTGATLIIRGLRAVSDFEFELALAQGNHDLDVSEASPRGIETVFLPTRAESAFLSSSMVREIASHGRSVERYAPPSVARALARRFPSK